VKRLLKCAAALLVAGCGATEPNQGEDTLVPGSVFFDFIGAGASVSRKFDATGTVSILDPQWGTTPMAIGELNTARPLRTSILGGIPQTDTIWDQALVRVNRASVGTSTYKTTCFGIAPECGADSSAVQVEFGARHVPSTVMTRYVCSILQGTLTITTLTTRHATGTFSGTGLCTEPNNVQTPFTVTNGVFDVGIIIPGKPLPKG